MVTVAAHSSKQVWPVSIEGSMPYVTITNNSDKPVSVSVLRIASVDYMVFDVPHPKPTGMM